MTNLAVATRNKKEACRIPTEVRPGSRDAQPARISACARVATAFMISPRQPLKGGAGNEHRAKSSNQPGAGEIFQ